MLGTQMAKPTDRTVETLKRMMETSEAGHWVSVLWWPDAGGDRFEEPNLRYLTEDDIVRINRLALRRGVTKERIEKVIHMCWDAAGEDNRLAQYIYADVVDGMGPDDVEA